MREYGSKRIIDIPIINESQILLLDEFASFKLFCSVLSFLVMKFILYSYLCGIVFCSFRQSQLDLNVQIYDSVYALLQPFDKQLGAINRRFQRTQRKELEQLIVRLNQNIESGEEVETQLNIIHELLKTIDNADLERQKEAIAEKHTVLLLKAKKFIYMQSELWRTIWSRYPSEEFLSARSDLFPYLNENYGRKIRNSFEELEKIFL